MKKIKMVFIAILFLSFQTQILCATECEPEIPVITIDLDIAPDSIPFGKLAMMEMLNQVAYFQGQVYTIEDGGRVILDELGIIIGDFNSTDELADILTGKDFDFEVDPRKQVFVDGFLMDENQESVLFRANNSFGFDVVRNSNGKPVGYKPHDHAGRLWFRMGEYLLDIRGVASMEVVANEKVWELHNTGNGFLVPAWYDFSYYPYHTLRLTFFDGTVAEYDRMGQRVEEQDFDLVSDIGFADFEKESVYNYRFGYDDAEPGWNPTIELYNPKKGWVDFDITENDRWWKKPEYVWVGTLDQWQTGQQRVMKYSDGYNLDETSILLDEDTTYFIVLEWGSETNIPVSWGDYGGKG
jgi:hypothetical protein